MSQIRLAQIAIARSGDKGAGANIGVIARAPRGFTFLRDVLTATKVEAFFKPMGVGTVVRYELPNLGALNFILPGVLDGGGSVSMRVDAQGKALGQILLEMTLDVPDDSAVGDDTMNEPLLRIDETDPRVTILMLDRADKRNALSLELIGQITEAIHSASRDKTRRAILFRASGPAFCAGLDLKEAIDPAKAHGSAVGLRNMYRAIATSPLITIAFAQGAAMGGGAGLLAACDFVVASTDFKLGYPEVHRGLVAALVTTLLRRQLGERIVRELVLLGQTVDAPRALQLGLINRIGTFDDAMQLARDACNGAPGAIARSKRLLDSLAPRSIEQDLQLALDFHLHARESFEAAEGMKAFLEKRPPRWGPRPDDA